MMQMGNIFKALSSRYPTMGRCSAQIFFTTTATVSVALLLLYSSGNAAESSADWQAEWQGVMAAAKKEAR